MTTHRSRTLLLILCAATVASAFTATNTGAASAQAGDGRSPAPALDWQPCARPDLGGPAHQECATLPVPLDYSDPAGPRLSLAVSRVRSERPAERRGVLMVLPGGPGGSGVQRLTQKGPALQKSVGGVYDLVSFDPRGTGGSTRAACELPADDRHLTTLRSWPAPTGGIDANIDRSRRTAELCARNGGPALRSFTSLNEVRDMELLRRALGETKLSAWGTSYGAYIAASYAQKFPHRTDRWVIDSVADPNPERLAQGWLRNTSQAVDDRFPDFASWASDPDRATDGEGPRLAETPARVRQLFLDLAARLDGSPRASTTPGVPLTGNRLRQALHTALYSDGNFPALAKLIDDARSTDPSVRPTLPPDVAGPLPDADAAVTIAVICNDVRWPRGRGAVDSYRRAVRSDRLAHPLTAGFPANITPCSFWKWDPAEKPTRITDRGPANILMIQNRRDPSTPYFGALKMREVLGERARLVSVDGGGHGVYLGTGNTCANRTVTDYLLTGVRPRRDTDC
ncbi:alpha/beta fold hydrolase [Streptomyces kunmingensis]|uniref:Alpha/beta fold hydrolase n=1 Tax=Streptomyces kunmingensis TaxID=68225 RepID=A0ABU6C354_9ACTN|nr:alpha/beta hydrolase [Streptomyces kunmingensis]MEB3959137.1 alpha/beta fold hydrolase [Streptomyces kunmingensis]